MSIERYVITENLCKYCLPYYKWWSASNSITSISYLVGSVLSMRYISVYNIHISYRHTMVLVTYSISKN